MRGITYNTFDFVFSDWLRQLHKYGLQKVWVARLTRDRWILVSREFEPHQRPRCFTEQETLLLLLSSGWFQERIQQ